MEKITLDAEAGQVSAELVRRGVPAVARVHVVVEVVEDRQNQLMAELAQAGGAFDWLGKEPDLYTDADLAQQAG